MSSQSLSLFLILCFTVEDCSPQPKKHLLQFLGCVDWELLLPLPEFVDRTMLMKDLLETPNKFIQITAPRHVGKTINLSMLKYFFELEVSDLGRILTERNHTTEAINDTEYYEIFVNSKIKLEITKHKEFMDENFGKYPVITLRAESIIVETFAYACEFYRHVIHDGYTNHRYLLKSQKLSDEEMRDLVHWCDPFNYVNTSVTLIENGLLLLTKCLYKHYNLPIIVLVDDYDSILNLAMMGAKQDEEFQRVMSLSHKIINNLVKDENSHLYVKKLLITGISHLAAAGASMYKSPGKSSSADSSEKRVTYYNFLSEHQFLKYYTLTRKEVDMVLSRPFEFTVPPNLIPLVHERYFGYIAKAKNGFRKVYNTWDIVCFLDELTVDDFWVRSGDLIKFEKILKKIQPIREKIDRLTQWKPIWIDVREETTVEDLMILRTVLRKNILPTEIEKDGIDLYFSHLLEQGYLSYNDSMIKSKLLRVPNLMVHDEFNFDLQDHYYDVFRFDHFLVDDLAKFFNEKISDEKHRGKPEEYEAVLREFHGFYKELYVETSKKLMMVLDSDILHNMMYTMVYHAKTYINFRKLELNSGKNKCEIDFIMIRKDLVIFMDVKYGKGLKSKALLKQMLDSQYERVLKHENLLPVPVAHRPNFTVYLALAVRENMDLSISCLLKSENGTDTIHVS